jgi:predicted peptidase
MIAETKTLLLTFIVLLGFNASLQGQDVNLFEKRTFISAAGDTLPYRILYPKDYNRSQKYPLILFLHGAGERGTDNELQLVHGSKLFLDSANRKNYPAIVVFPQCPKDSYWSSVLIDRTSSPLTLTFDYSFPPTPALSSAIQLTKKIIREETVDNNRVYVIGLSMGGMGTFEAVYREPKLFAAAMPICGGGDTKRYDKRLKNFPFWVFHGDADAVVDVKLSRDMVNRLKQIKADVKYTEYPKVNHNSWDYAFAEPDFLSWLFEQRR